MTATCTGNPWLRLLRREVEALISETSGQDSLRKKKIQKELDETKKESRKLKLRMAALERRRTELTKELAE